MDPTTLIGPSNPLGYPAPYGFLIFFKVLGFTLHTIPMNLWYAGIVLAMLLRWRGGEHARRLAARLMRQMPIIIALGINFGIIPLLFIQVAYYRVFYPATVLMAWPWFSIIPLLTVAYYGVYVYVSGLKADEAHLSPIRQAAGWVSAVLFIGIGFLFSNALSLMVNVAAWPTLWERTSVAGAALGIALNVGDASLWPRWLMMFGLALTTTAAYIVVDAAFFAGRESDAYRRWVAGFAPKLYTVGLVWFALAGTWYTFGTWPTSLRQAMFGGPRLVLTLLTALAPGLPWLVIAMQRRGITRWWALLTGLAQFGVLAINAVSRQVVQNLELSRFLDVTAEAVRTQWGPMILFLISFAVGVAIILWMVRQVVLAERRATA